jgi:hypothetical protein
MVSLPRKPNIVSLWFDPAISSIPVGSKYLLAEIVMPNVVLVLMML